jgi:hypothetical protein
LRQTEDDRNNSLILPEMAGQWILILLRNCFTKNRTRCCHADLVKPIEGLPLRWVSPQEGQQPYRQGVGKDQGMMSCSGEKDSAHSARVSSGRQLTLKISLQGSPNWNTSILKGQYGASRKASGGRSLP